MSAAPALAISGSNLTGEAAFSVCLRIGRELHAAAPAAGERGDLAGLARDLLAQHEIAAADLGELRIDLGPGSYTGLRVAVTFARFLQHFGGLPVLAGDSLALLASAASPADRDDGRLRPLLDARRGRFHCAATVIGGGKVQHRVEPAAMTLEEIAASIAPGDTFVVPHTLGDDHKSALRATGTPIAEVRDLAAIQLFSPLLDLRPHTTEELGPRYLMATYAE